MSHLVLLAEEAEEDPKGFSSSFKPAGLIKGGRRFRPQRIGNPPNGLLHRIVVIVVAKFFQILAYPTLPRIFLASVAFEVFQLFFVDPLLIQSDLSILIIYLKKYLNFSPSPDKQRER